MDVNLSGLGLRGQRRFMIRDCQIKSRALETKYDAGRAPMIKKPISADSHITEPPHCYVDYIDPKFRDRAPRIQRIDKIGRSEEHTSELQSLMRISYAVFCLKK